MIWFENCFQLENLSMSQRLETEPEELEDYEYNLAVEDAIRRLEDEIMNTI